MSESGIDYINAVFVCFCVVSALLIVHEVDIHRLTRKYWELHDARRRERKERAEQ